MTAKEKIEKVIIGWFSISPFFFEYGLRTNFVRDDSVKTMGVFPIKNNIIRIVYCESFVLSLKEREIEGVLIHEFLHLIMMTFSRQAYRKMDLWNVATDIANNDMIKNFSLNGDEVILPEGSLTTDTLLEKNYSGNIVAEAIYDFLKQDENEDEQKKSNNWDNHSGINENIDFDSEDQSLLEEALEASKVRDASNGHKSFDNISKIETVLRPTVNWKSVLRKKIKSNIYSRNGNPSTTWKRPHRRDLPFAEKISKSIKVNVAIDTSGSISSGYLQQFFSEIESILSSTIKSTNLIQWDTKVKSVEKYKPGSWKNFKMRGGGGTNIQDLFLFLKKTKQLKNLTVIFTDGYFDHTFDSFGANVLFVTTDKEVSKFSNIKISA